MAYFPKRHTSNNIVLLGKGATFGKPAEEEEKFRDDVSEIEANLSSRFNENVAKEIMRFSGLRKAQQKRALELLDRYVESIDNSEIDRDEILKGLKKFGIKGNKLSRYNVSILRNKLEERVGGRGFRGMKEFIDEEETKEETMAQEEKEEDEDEYEPSSKRQKLNPDSYSSLVRRLNKLPADIINEIAKFRGIKGLSKIIQLERLYRQKVIQYNNLLTRLYGDFDPEYPDSYYYGHPGAGPLSDDEIRLNALRNEINQIESDMDVFIRFLNRSGFPFSSDL